MSWGIPNVFSGAIMSPKYYVDQAVFWSQIANNDYVADQIIEEDNMCRCDEVHDSKWDQSFCDAAYRMADEIREAEDALFLSAMEGIASSTMLGRVFEIGSPKRAMFLSEGPITCLLRD